MLDDPDAPSTVEEATSPAGPPGQAPCGPCGGTGRWWPPIGGLRPCPCCRGAGLVSGEANALGIAFCLACRGRGALGNDEAVVCPVCAGFGGVPLRNPVVAEDGFREGLAA